MKPPRSLVFDASTSTAYSFKSGKFRNQRRSTPASCRRIAFLIGNYNRRVLVLAVSSVGMAIRRYKQEEKNSE